MAKLLAPRQEVRQALESCIRAGRGLTAKAEVAKATGGERDWLELVATWRDETVAVLNRLFEDADIGRLFAGLSETVARSSPRYEFPYATTSHEQAVSYLQSLIGRLELAAGASKDATAIDSLHPEIYSKCRKLYESGDYAEAVEKGFKIVRDRLRALTSYETGSNAFGKGELYIDGSAAPHVDGDFQEAVKFLTMAIDFFRNEKSHTADGNISDPLRAYEYLRLSSLAMHLLDGSKLAS
jgi:uncharacterized protein (TIGR02391 family)